MNGIQPAFPSTEPHNAHYIIHHGLSKREYFAGQIAAGTWTGYHRDMVEQPTMERMAKAAVEFADALIAALEAK